MIWDGKCYRFWIWKCYFDLICEHFRRCSDNYGNFCEVSFYTLAPLSLCCTLAPEVFKYAAEQAAEFIVKGKQQMAAFEFEWWEVVSPLIKLGWLPWIGATIFLWGWIHQHRCHVILVSSLSNASLC